MRAVNYRKILLAVLFCSVFVLFGITTFAQTKKIRWTTELCEFEGTYDSTKYTEAQLRNTQELLTTVGSIPLFTDSTAGNYGDIKKLSLEELDKEYKTRFNELKNLEIVKSEYWETLRQKKLKAMEQFYNLSRITIQAYTNPALLRQYTSAAVCVKKYADPIINGGDELLKAWRGVNEESRKTNGDPERVRRIFEKEYNSPHKLRYALIEVMAFGWWNCANHTIEHLEFDENYEKNYRKLFKSIKTIYCDEP